MSQFVESIRLQDGVFVRMNYHQSRVEEAFRFAFPEQKAFHLGDTLLATAFPTQGLYKCRVLYDTHIRDIQFQPYHKRNVQTLKVIETTLPTVPYKLRDREELNRLFDLRGKCDDVLLVRDGLITDTWTSNVALYDGKQWYTPRNPVLLGTHRSFLIDEGILTERDIHISDLNSYHSLSLVNAMLDLGELIVPVANIE
jgi:4-amino-4-deoxychorismate lyase